MSGPKSTDRTGLAIILSLIALLLFDIMGLVVKHLSASYSAAELSAYRNLFGLVPTVIALWWSTSWHQSGRKLKIRQWRLAIFRGITVAFAQLSFYAALGLIAFATATTISYSNALFLTALAVPLLGEKVGPIRWFAVLIGFVGVVMVIGPGRDAFTWAAVLAILAAFLYAIAAITARIVDDDVPTPVLNLYTQGIALVTSFTLVISLGGFTPIPTLADAFWITVMGCCGGVAVLFLIASYRMTEPSNLAPFTYFGIPMAFGLGWVFFNEAPIQDLFPGAILIVLGGLLIVFRERQLKRKSGGSHLPNSTDQ